MQHLLNSRLHPLFGRKVLVLRYRGRRTRHTYGVPVMYATAGTDLVVMAGNPGAKTWWRNFTEESQTVEVVLDGTVQPRTARRVPPSAPEYPSLLTAYLRRFPGFVVPADAVLIRLADRLPPSPDGDR
jgi:hypothetical protein